MKRYVTYSITILAFFVIGIVIANFLIMPSVVHMGKEVVVPNVFNVTLDNAIKELKKEELEGVVIERRYDAIIEEGKVIIQDPLPGAKVKSGRLIHLSISLGPQTIKVPYLIGIEVEKAKGILSRLGLGVAYIDSQRSDSIAPNKVIATIPVAEAEVRRGDAVGIIVSTGMNVRMPAVVGKNVREVRPLLEKMGLILSEITEVEGSGTRGSIIVQNPEPETQIAVGDSVRLIVVK